MTRSSSPYRLPTRADVARYAGVSEAVVSYVMNGGPRPVAPETAERVRAAIDVLGYRPNLSARALKRGSTEMLGIILSDISNPLFAEFALQIEMAALAHGHAVLMTNSLGDTVTERSLIEDLMSRQVAGLLLASTRSRPDGIDKAVRFGIPTTVIDCTGPIPGHSSLGPDTVGGTKLVLEHLIEVHQPRSIGLVAGEGGNKDLRQRSWQEATRAAGLPDGPKIRVPFSRDGGYVGGLRLLDTKNPPGAIFASSDLQAVGVLRAARELGVSVPEDLALVAFDGTKEAEFCCPPLTVSRQPLRDMAIDAVNSVLARDPGPPSHRSYPMELIIGQSCGCSGNQSTDHARSDLKLGDGQ
jgi:LacI family transcriptional regulator